MVLEICFKFLIKLGNQVLYLLIIGSAKDYNCLWSESRKWGQSTRISSIYILESVGVLQTILESNQGFNYDERTMARAILPKLLLLLNVSKSYPLYGFDSERDSHALRNVVYFSLGTLFAIQLSGRGPWKPLGVRAIATRVPSFSPTSYSQLHIHLRTQ
ncbi:hypothetical protein VNO77_21337 [Canavalia gladiata]|uniref:Uncharacterized protein n=1 Tax=Canavalia gladiata TaxID=3824 RepID=A0AAN9LVZ1_CANGL